LSSLLSAEGELLLDKTRPDVLGDREVRLPGKKSKLISDILGSTYADIRYPIFNIRYPGRKNKIDVRTEKTKTEATRNLRTIKLPFVRAF